LTAPGRMFIPGDISSAAFFIIAAILIPNSRLVIRNVGLNPTRTSLLRLLKRMGADIRILKKGACLYAFEPYADIEVRARPLKAITLHEKDIAYCIDELPILCVAACFAKGTTRIYGAAELRVKETDRIHSMVANLKRMGACIRNVNNDVIIKGTGRLRSARVSSFGDHRTAMSMTIAGLLAEGQTEIRNTRCVNKSFPGFQRVLKAICVP